MENEKKTEVEAVAVDEAKVSVAPAPTPEKDELRMSRVNLAKSLQKAGYSNEGIAKYMGLSESSVRELLK